ncbi:MAG: archaeal heat shock protein Hsp20 [Methanobacteriota archaeon]
MADPWEKRRKGTPRDPFGDDFDEFFREFGTEFEKMRTYMARMFEEMQKSGPGKPGEPYVYGFSLKVGPDGKPQIQEFGNTNPVKAAIGEAGREPLTDVIEGEKEVSITVELPGVEKDDINLRVQPRRVTIAVDHAKRRYHKVIDLPTEVKTETTEATYKNGVLDVTIQKVKGRDEGTRVPIK